MLHDLRILLNNLPGVATHSENIFELLISIKQSCYFAEIIFYNLSWLSLELEISKLLTICHDKLFHWDNLWFVLNKNARFNSWLLNVFNQGLSLWIYLCWHSNYTNKLQISFISFWKFLNLSLSGGQRGFQTNIIIFVNISLFLC